MPSPTHICPKCREPRSPGDFINERAKQAKWCVYCRMAYRQRLINLHVRDKTKPKREEAIDAEVIAIREGYEDHPLATLLALSHIAGAKRALAIRDGKSWRGKKAWRAYYEAKELLAEGLVSEWQKLLTQHAREIEAQWDAWRASFEKRDPNQKPVS